MSLGVLPWDGVDVELAINGHRALLHALHSYIGVGHVAIPDYTHIKPTTTIPDH